MVEGCYDHRRGGGRTQSGVATVDMLMSQGESAKRTGANRAGTEGALELSSREEEKTASRLLLLSTRSTF